MQSVEAAENKPQCSDNCGEGIFPTMEEAIDAAFIAQRKLLDCSMSDKDRFVKAIRNQLSKKENLKSLVWAPADIPLVDKVINSNK